MYNKYKSYHSKSILNGGHIVRQIININDTWTFQGKDSEIVDINIPHTWNAFDGQDGGNDYYRGTCMYRKQFVCPSFNAIEEMVYLEFQGVNSSCSVHINDLPLVTHQGGYSTFRSDITPYLKKDNMLEVRVDNQDNDEVYPQKADFTFYGGIYRDVNLIIVSKEHFALEEDGGPGLRITSEIKKNNAYIEVETSSNVKNERVLLTILDKDMNVVAESAGGKQQYIEISGVHLWNGLQDPYLYTLQAELTVNGEIKDRITSKFGVRNFYIDPEKGFFLNGKSYPLRGVSRHQDWKNIGNALTHSNHIRDMELIREIGANTIRLAHYQHDQFFYDLCDKYGIIIWVEIPYISMHMENGKQNTIDQMKELIVQNYNHPSIITWGLSNEITIAVKNKKDMLENHELLHDLCHEMDKTRLTSLACYAMCNPFSKIAHLSDLLGYNLYLGWYVPGLFLNDLFIRMFHLIYPKRPLGFSEYGAEGMPNLHSEKPRRGDHTEEYQAIYHEYMLKCFARYPFMWSTNVWNMFDFAADARNQGGEAGMNHKGLVTFDRETKKDSFYLYKTYWQKEAVVHICSKRFIERTANHIVVKVYSNQENVSLYLNEKLVEKKSGDKVFCFKIKTTSLMNIKAVGGSAEDHAVFRKVSTENKEYKLQGKSNSHANWV